MIPPVLLLYRNISNYPGFFICIQSQVNISLKVNKNHSTTHRPRDIKQHFEGKIECTLPVNEGEGPRKGNGDGNERDQVREDGGRECWERQLASGGISGIS